MVTSRSRQAPQEFAELLLQLGRSAYAERAAGDLTAAQWAALRYFSRANRFSRTVSGFADFHVTTRGTASQTVRSLVDRGYLQRLRSDRDGRSVLFDLTREARDILLRDPLNAVTRAAASLPPDRLARLLQDLRAVGDTLAGLRAQSAAGICHRCGHLLKEQGNFRCGLMNEQLEAGETAEICLRFAANPVA